jgi:hypothetical protein
MYLRSSIDKPESPTTSDIELIGPVPGSLRHSTKQFAFAGLFAGIGGLQRGFQEQGHRSVLLCDANDRARAVLEIEQFCTIGADDVTAWRTILHADSRIW